MLVSRFDLRTRGIPPSFYAVPHTTVTPTGCVLTFDADDYKGDARQFYVRMSAAEAREMAARLIACAEHVEKET
jgi:hypothetical protein